MKGCLPQEPELISALGRPIARRVHPVAPELRKYTQRKRYADSIQPFHKRTRQRWRVSAPHATFVPRKAEVDAWDNEDFVNVVKATGRKALSN